MWYDSLSIAKSYLFVSHQKSCIQNLQTGVMGLSINRAAATSTKFGVLEQSNLKQGYSTRVIDAGMINPNQLDLGLTCPKLDQF